MDALDSIMDGSGSTSDSENDVHPDLSLNNLHPTTPAPNNRVIRRRARRACAECHKRKVRCDVTMQGQTCTNCRLDGLTCVARAKDGRRRLHTKPLFAAGGPLIESETLQPTTLDNCDVNLASATGLVGDRHPSISVTWGGPSLGKEGGPGNLSNPPSQNIDLMYSYYGFLTSESLSHILPEDFKFLESKGCFHLPSKNILDEFVREYFLHIHPILPVLDEGEFWEMYNSGRSSTCPGISLLVFHAMLFVSSAFVSASTITALGFTSAIEARTTFYRRAKLLYDFNSTYNSTAIVQAALLLTYYTSDTEPLANTSWLRTAIMYAKVENINSYHREDSSLSLKERSLHKRLWWCAISRDRVMALGLRRPIQITRSNFDFDEACLSEDDLASEFNISHVYDSATKRGLAKILESQMKLAVVLTNTLSLIYPNNSSEELDQLDRSALMAIPGKVQRCKDELNTWKVNADKASISTGSLSTSHNSISLYSGLTQIYYQSARAALCHHESFALQTAAQQPPESPPLQRIGSELHTAITSITENLGNLVRLDAARFLPVSIVAYIALPIVLNSIDVHSSASNGQRTESIRRHLRFYNEVVNLCHSRYSGTEAAITNVAKTVTLSQGLPASAIIQSPPKGSAVATTHFTWQSSVHQGSVDDWFEVFVSQPKQYLRMALMIDYVFRKGRLPNTTELPRRVLLENCMYPSGIPQALPSLLTDPKSPVANLSMMLGNKRRVNLDYFDFGFGDGDASLDRGVEVIEDDITDEALFDQSMLEDNDVPTFGDEDPFAAHANLYEDYSV